MNIDNTLLIDQAMNKGLPYSIALDTVNQVVKEYGKYQNSLTVSHILNLHCEVFIFNQKKMEKKRDIVKVIKTRGKKLALSQLVNLL